MLLELNRVMWKGLAMVLLILTQCAFLLHLEQEYFQIK